MDTNYKEKLISFYRSKKRMPTYSEMMGLFGFKSKNAVFRLVEKFIDAGLVAKDHLGRLIPNASLGNIPLLGSVTAGFPATVEEEMKDTLDLNDYLLTKTGTTYMLEVDGNSMIDAHIADGDMVLAERTNDAKDGEIVIAEIDGEFTMKYLKKKGDAVWLEPANKAFKPMYPKHSFSIVARIKAVIRKY